MINFILAYCSATIALIVGITSLFVKSRNKLFLLQLVSNIFYATNFALLNAIPGAIVLGIAFIRNLVSFYMSKHNMNLELSELVVFEAAYIVCTAITFSQPTDLLVSLANMIFTYGIWQKNRTVFLISQIISSIMSFIYNIIHISYIGALLEFIVIISATVSLIILIKSIKNKKLKSTNFE